MKTAAIIVSAGSGKRFGSTVPKQFHQIDRIPVIVRALWCFEKTSSINAICLVIQKKYMDHYRSLINKYRFKKIYWIIQGGRERQESVYNGLSAIGDGWDMVVVHDGVRPFVSNKLLKAVLQSAVRFGASVPGIKPVDTIKISNNNNFVLKTLERNSLCAIQTPQAFRYDILKRAHEKARDENYVGTDDAELVERCGFRVKIVNGDYRNIKITQKHDIVLGEAIARYLL